MINNGPVQIGTNIEHVDGIDNRHITVITPVTPEDQPQTEARVEPAETKPRKAPKASRSKILLRQFKGNDVNFVRVIYALHQEGFFESENGGKPTLKDVFEAFGIAINEDIDE